jgi:hypothetical protein
MAAPLREPVIGSDMPAKLNKVYAVLKEMKLIRQSNTNGKSHELWRDENGREVQLAPRGDVVPDRFLRVLFFQLETQGICSRRYFKRRLRKI